MAQPPVGHGQGDDLASITCIKDPENQAEISKIDNPPPEMMKNMTANFEIETNLPYRPSFQTHNYLIDQKVNKEVSEILTAALTNYIDQAISLTDYIEDMQLCSIEVLSVHYFQPVKDADRNKDGKDDWSVAENVTYWDRFRTLESRELMWKILVFTK